MFTRTEFTVLATEWLRYVKQHVYTSVTSVELEPKSFLNAPSRILPVIFTVPLTSEVCHWKILLLSGNSRQVFLT